MHARRIATALAAVAVSGVAALGVQAPAAAQEYPPGPPTAPPGESGNTPAAAQARGIPFEDINRPVAPGTLGFVQFGAGTVDPGSRVRGTFESTPVPLGTVPATSTGAFTFSFQVPANATAGQHHAVFRGTRSGEDVTLRVPITVAATGTGASTGGADTDADGSISVGGVQLPRTGAEDVVPMVATGVSLVLVGAGVVLMSRRRRDELDRSVA